MIQMIVLSGAAAAATYALIATLAPNIGKIVDALHGRPRVLDETRRERWRRVHMTGDRRPMFQERAR